MLNSKDRGEPFGRVTIEVMVFGLPVVATRAGGTKEIVQDDETGRRIVRSMAVPQRSANRNSARADRRVAERLLAIRSVIAICLICGVNAFRSRAQVEHVGGLLVLGVTWISRYAVPPFSTPLNSS